MYHHFVIAGFQWQ